MLTIFHDPSIFRHANTHVPRLGPAADPCVVCDWHVTLAVSSSFRVTSQSGNVTGPHRLLYAVETREMARRISASSFGTVRAGWDAADAARAGAPGPAVPVALASGDASGAAGGSC